MSDPSTVTEKLIDAALMHVAFDGWTETTFRAAVADADVNPTVARGLFPRGAVDLACAFHRRADALMVRTLAGQDLNAMRFRDRIAHAVRVRLESVEDKEAVRRATTLFALPIHAADGAKLIWETSDHIWHAVGDASEDLNWYTKRATLAGVYSATVLYWLGDDSIDNQATWDFLDRRIEDVMGIERAKAQVRKVPGVGALLDGLSGLIRAPVRRDDLPGTTR